MKRISASLLLLGATAFCTGCSKSNDAPSTVADNRAPSASAPLTPTAQAGDSSASDATDANAAPPDPYAVPEGGVPELLAYVEELQEYRPRTSEEYRAYQEKMTAALQTAAERILALDKDESSATHQTAKLLLLKSRIQSINIRDASPSEWQSLASDLISALQSKAKTGLTRSDVSIALSLGRTLEYADPQLAAELFGNVAAILEKANNPEFAREIQRSLGAARRLRLPGNPIELNGPLLSGGELDWASYRGKVVLVDFWATWCGPCIAELPNVKKLYDSYHDRGFDVVGISLDKNRADLEKHLEQDPLPWVTLFDESSSGWENPMATYYGISGIPTAILVDKEGKVISLRARGTELATLLEQQLGAATVAEAQPAELSTP